MVTNVKNCSASCPFYRRLPDALRRLLAQCVTIGAFCALFVLSACDSRNIEQLIPGQATEAEVGSTMGRPTAIYEIDSRARILEFARAPEGQVTYFAEIDANGKLARRIENVLTPQNFARVRPDMTQDEVRRILGTPSYTEQYPAQPGERIWTWRYLRNNGTESRIFSAHFGPDGRVLKVSEDIDPRAFKG